MLSKRRTVVQRVGGHLASYFALARGYFDHDDQVPSCFGNEEVPPRVAEGRWSADRCWSLQHLGSLGAEERYAFFMHHLARTPSLSTREGKTTKRTPTEHVHI